MCVLQSESGGCGHKSAPFAIKVAGDRKMEATFDQASAATSMNSESLNRLDVQQRMERLDRLGEWLDTSIEIPGMGFRIGWDTIIGLVPGIGDVATTAMSVWIIKEARKMGVSRFTLGRMIANTTVDAVVGSVPVAGDLFDAAFRSNIKNLKLIKASLRKRGLLDDEDEGSEASVRVVS